MQKIELTNREKTLLMLLVGLVIPALLYLYIIAPQWDTYQSNRAQLKVKEEQLASYKQLESDGKLQKQIREYIEQITKMQTMIPQQYETADFLYMIYQAADGYEVTLEHVDFEVEKPKESSGKTNGSKSTSKAKVTQDKNKKEKNLGIDQIHVVTAQIKVTAQYPNFRKFIGELENLPRINVVNSYSLKLNGQKALEGYVKIYGYSYPANLPDITYKSVVPKAKPIGKIDPFKV